MKGKSKQIFCIFIGMNTLFVGHKLIKLLMVDSTNSYANELLKKENTPEGTIIYAQNQINGRGQRENNWISEPSMNLTLSIILTPNFLPIDQQFYLTKSISIATADFVSSILLKERQRNRIQIKWPNDIYVNDKKIAGILIENSIRNNQIINSIVGVGININQVDFGNLNATSLKLEDGKEHDLQKCLDRFCSFVEASYLQLKEMKCKLIDNKYLNSIYKLGALANYRVGKQTISARIINVSKEGKLILKTPENQDIICGFKEIELLS